MCTAINFVRRGHYFGRTLDLEYHYDEKVVVCPRDYPFEFTDGTAAERHHAIIGAAYVAEGYPLFYEGVNERGLCAAALSFPESCRYAAKAEGKGGCASFELIPKLLCLCDGVDMAARLLENTCITDKGFGDLAPSPLHWIVADKKRAIVAEPLESGLKIYDCPLGVLTNEPGYDFHTLNLCGYMGLSACKPENRMGAKGLECRRRGMGAIGLPGDYSSQSRFVRGVFVKENILTQEGGSEADDFFRILSSVEVPAGCVRLENGKTVKTVYSCCCDAEKGVYYWKTYENTFTSAVDMHAEELDSAGLICYPMFLRRQINALN